VQTWSAALTTANNGAWCGYSDWRIPNVNELLSLVNYGEIPANWLNKTIAAGGGGFSNVAAGTYWTSTTFTQDDAYAFYVHMLRGSLSSQAKTSSLYVFPVRGGR